MSPLAILPSSPFSHGCISRFHQSCSHSTSVFLVCLAASSGPQPCSSFLEGLGLSALFPHYSFITALWGAPVNRTIRTCHPPAGNLSVTSQCVRLTQSSSCPPTPSCPPCLLSTSHAVFHFLRQISLLPAGTFALSFVCLQCSSSCPLSHDNSNITLERPSLVILR